MSNAKQLSVSRTGTNLPSISFEEDAKLFNLMELLAAYLSKKYNIHIDHKKRLLNTDLYQRLNKSRQRHELVCKSNVRPDGGILTIDIGKHKNLPICISENKKQGEGKKQAKGNAIERAAKNIMFFQQYLATEKILPYVIFCHGSDFEQRSCIIDRLATMANYYPMQQVHIYKDSYNLGGVSIFYKQEIHNAFKNIDIIMILLTIAETSLEYYCKKYGNGKVGVS